MKHQGYRSKNALDSISHRALHLSFLILTVYRTVHVYISFHRQEQIRQAEKIAFDFLQKMYVMKKRINYMKKFVYTIRLIQRNGKGFIGRKFDYSNAITILWDKYYLSILKCIKEANVFEMIRIDVKDSEKDYFKIIKQKIKFPLIPTTLSTFLGKKENIQES